MVLFFYKVSRNYGIEGPVGTAYRREFETRMFTHASWTQRLYCSPFDPDINETLEVYSKPDGSPWLSYRHARPSLGRIISARLRWGEKLDLKKELDAVRITKHEIALPRAVANEIEWLWRRMLLGLAKEPVTEERILVPHAPAFIAFAREGNSIKTGKIAMAAYDSPAYREFVRIVDDLIKACNRGGSAKDLLLGRLPEKIRALRGRLEKP